jgi:hypothetical protein
MDCVPRRHRAKVSAADSVRTFSWSGSAAAGGWLIQRYGFQATFLITAGIKLLAFVPMLPLLAFVPDGVCGPPGARAARLRRQQQWAREGEAAAEARPPSCRARPGSSTGGECDGGGTQGRSSVRQPLLAGRSAS